MAFDGIVCSAVVAELNQSILGGKVNKIFEPNNNEIVLGIYSGGKNYALNININPVNYRINLTTHNKPNPQNVLNFCMVLRKHLTGGTIKKIYMNGLERVVFIDINCYNELNDLITKTIVIELMGKHSNIILLSSSNIIIDSLRHLDKLDNSLRDILPGYSYVSIENTKLDFLSCSFDTFYNVLKSESNTTISDIASKNFIGFSKSGILSMLSDLSMEDKNNCSLDDLKKLFQYIKDMIGMIGTNIDNVKLNSVNICKKSDYYLKFSESSEYLKINFFLDDFYFSKDITESFLSARNNLLKLILDRLKKLDSKLKTANNKIAECSKMENYKLYGELITSNLYKLPTYNQEIITLENYYDNNAPLSIKLDSSINPAGNAKKFFKKYRKLQNAYSIVSKQRDLINNEIEYLDSIVYELNTAETIDDINNIFVEVSDVLDLNLATSSKSNTKKNTKLTALLPSEYKIDGFTVLVGKNNKQNDYLTCKLARNYDLWFHTKEIHGSHVVLKLDKSIKKVPDSIIYKCATIAAFYSKAKLSQNVPVDYTYVKYVKKPNGAKPGMVIYTDNKTLFVNPKKPS